MQLTHTYTSLPLVAVAALSLWNASPTASFVVPVVNTMGVRRPAFGLRSSMSTTNGFPEDSNNNNMMIQPSSEAMSSATAAATAAVATAPIVKPKAAKAAGGNHKVGVFSPVVFASKMVMGEDKLNKIRAKAISMHGDVIKNFVDTSESTFGNVVLKQLFSIADANDSGTIDEEELSVALSALGFDWLHEEQIKAIFARADKDANNAIDLEEWMKEAPKTLKINLVKLAKKNGGDMGLLV